MSKSNCNLCLAVNRRTINIMNTQLQTLYEKLANFKVSPHSNLWLCCVCHTRLKQCYQLSRLARKTCCFLTTGLLQTNIKLKSEGMGLVNLSRSTISHFTVPSPNSNSIIQVLVKNEPLRSLRKLAFYEEDLGQYEDVGYTEDYPSDENKKYTVKEILENDNCSITKDIACLKNKVEIEINTHSGTNEVKIKKEELTEIKKEIMEDDSGFEPATVLDTGLYTCNLCSHMFSTMALFIQHEKAHKSGKLKPKDKLHTGKRFVCPICGKHYADKKGMTRHQKIHMAVRPFICEICNKTFSRRDHYNKHAQIHPGLHLYTCHTCNTHFPNVVRLKTHECTPREHDPASYSCDACPESFDRWDLYHAHKTDIHGISTDITVKRLGTGDPSEDRDICLPKIEQKRKKKKKYSCDKCNVHYNKQYALETHILSIHKEARFECDHCSKVFLRRANLCLHLRMHTGEQRYCCDVCGKTFTYKSSLNVHRRVHFGLKPYACDVCNKKFTAYGHLAEHKLVHSDVRAFVCEICTMRFKRRRHLKNHMKSHTGEKPYTCDICFKSFARNDNFIVHRRIHTGEKPFVCDVCGETFSENRHLKKHKVIHE